MTEQSFSYTGQTSGQYICHIRNFKKPAIQFRGKYCTMTLVRAFKMCLYKTINDPTGTSDAFSSDSDLTADASLSPFFSLTITPLGRPKLNDGGARHWSMLILLEKNENIAKGNS
jgi:hypothetical protein